MKPDHNAKPKSHRQPKPRQNRLRWKAHPQGKIDQYGRIFDSRDKFVGCGYANH